MDIIEIKKKAIYHRQWRKNNPEKCRAIKKKWKLKNKDKIAAQQRRWRIKNPQKIQEIRKRWNKKNSYKIIEYARNLRKKPDYRYKKYKNSAKIRGYEFKINLKEFTKIIFSSSSKCFYCGDKNDLGIDRKINSIGYTVKNSVACCWKCNKLKGKMNDEQFIKLCITIAKNNSFLSKQGRKLLEK